MGMSKRHRLIARLDIKGPNLIKGIHLEGLRVLGDPNLFALKYYQQGADELIYMDAVASLYGRNNLEVFLQSAAHNIFIPITVGGGIRSIDDAYRLLRAGADKVAINTAAISDPNLIENLAKKFGSQCVVLSIEAKMNGSNSWEALTNYGRERTGVSVIDWVKRGVNLGAGEILLTSVDCEGTRQGFDIPLLQSVSSAVNVPIIVSGGIGSSDHAVKALYADADAVAVAASLHYDRLTIDSLRQMLKDQGFGVRNYDVI
jgi:imidazole glycerol-phosphate synthase subunit HisF